MMKSFPWISDVASLRRRTTDSEDAKQERISESLGRDQVVLANRQHQILYIPIPKNSCTFFKQLLLEHSEQRDSFKASECDPHRFLVKNRSLRTVEKGMLDDANWIRFVVFRDPIDRTVSGYLNKFVRNANYRGAIDLADRYREKAGKESTGDCSISFSQFVDAICSEDDIHLDLHWRPQVWFVQEVIDRIDWRIAIERIPEFLEILSKRIGVELHNEKTRNQTRYGQHTLESRLYESMPKDLKRLETMPDRQALVTPEMQERLLHRFAADRDLYAEAVEAKWPSL